MESKVFIVPILKEFAIYLGRGNIYVCMYCVHVPGKEGSKGGERRMTIQRSICQISRSSQKKEITGS